MFTASQADSAIPHIFLGGGGGGRGRGVGGGAQSLTVHLTPDAAGKLENDAASWLWEARCHAIFAKLNTFMADQVPV